MVQNLGGATWRSIQADAASWRPTEKVDGASLTVWRTRDGVLHVAGRNWELDPATSNIYWQAVALSKIGERLEVGQWLQGEVAGPKGHWVFTGDTGPNPPLWARLRQLPVAQLIIETAFRNDEWQLAHVSRHLHPAALGAELAELAQGVDVFITHVKPGELDAVMTEIGALDLRHRVHALVTGQVMPLG